MKYQEKKYKTDSFKLALDILSKSKAPKEKEVVNTHYYAQKEGNDVVKLVVSIDRCEIHTLLESQGKYTLTQKIPVINIEDGFRRLKKQGYNIVNIVKMDYTDYVYKGGIVGLYTINDFFYSIILDFPDGQHDGKEKEFGLSHSDVITVPYNKYLEQIGKLKSIHL